MNAKTRGGGRIFLIGMMAAGKTTIGRHLATLLGYRFHDADRTIEERAGADISWIFEMEGEEGFRNREQRVIEDLTGHDGVVLATGGGAVLRKSNRRLLRQRGVVFYLKTTPEIIAARARQDKNRPLLQVDDARARIATLLQQREPLYKAVAHLEVATDGKSPKSVAADIAVKLGDQIPMANSARQLRARPTTGPGQ